MKLKKRTLRYISRMLAAEILQDAIKDGFVLSRISEDAQAKVTKRMDDEDLAYLLEQVQNIIKGLLWEDSDNGKGQHNG
jgi:GGDEF domain-containing protein